MTDYICNIWFTLLQDANRVKYDMKGVKQMEYAARFMYLIYRDLHVMEHVKHSEALHLVNALTDLLQTSVTPHVSKPNPNGRKYLENHLKLHNKMTVTLSKLAPVHVDAFNAHFYAHFPHEGLLKPREGYVVSFEDHDQIVGALFEAGVVDMTLEAFKEHNVHAYDTSVPPSSRVVENEGMATTSTQHPMHSQPEQLQEQVIEVLHVVDACHFFAWIGG